MNEMTKDALCHAWSDAKKAAYNREYYRKHKDLWEKYRKSLGDNQVLIGKVREKKIEAERLVDNAEKMREQYFKKAQKDKKMASRAAKAGLPAAANALNSSAYDQYGNAKEYLNLRNKLKNSVNALTGDESGLHAIRRYKKKAGNEHAPSASVPKNDLDWKLKPVKNKATRKAKEFVSNWKSGATSISGAVKSASSKLGKSFLDTKIATRVTNFRSPSGTTTTKSSVTIGDALKGSKKPKRTLSGQPNGFVENWKQGAGDIVGAFKKKKRK